MATLDPILSTDVLSIGGALPLNTIETRALLYEKASPPMMDMLLGIITEVRLQASNAWLSIEMTPSGMVTVPVFPLGNWINSVVALL
jgi:hypothetical protein